MNHDDQDPAPERILAILGHPIAGNPAQFAAESAIADAGADARVLSIDLPPTRVATALDGMAAMRFAGIWVDASCFDAVCDYLKCCPVDRRLPALRPDPDGGDWCWLAGQSRAAAPDDGLDVESFCAALQDWLSRPVRREIVAEAIDEYLSL